MKISGVSGNELKMIIDYAYLRKCIINNDPHHVLNLLHAATHLGVTELKRLCEEHLMKALDMMTSVELLESNAGYGLYGYTVQYIFIVVFDLCNKLS
jgi:hypothetical protein